MSSLDKLFGTILLAPGETGEKIYKGINKAWLVTDFHRAVYKGLGKIYQDKKEANLLTLVEAVKFQGGLQKDYLVQISRLTNGVSHLEVLHVNSILTTIDIEYREKRASILSQSINQVLVERGFDIPSLKGLYQKGLDLCEIDLQEDRTSNVDLIFDLLDKHEKARNGELGGIKLPYRCLDEVILLEDVDLMVIGARPAMGKTAFVVSTATRMALSGQKVLIFALEMSRVQVMRRVVANLTGIDSNVLKYGRCNRYQMDLVYKVQEMPELENLVIIEGSQTISDIARTIQAERPGVVFVDYLQKIKPEGTSDLYTAATRASNGLKEISQNIQVPIIAMAQLSRPDATRMGKRPSLPDLRQSGEIEQDASIVAFIHRPEYYGEDLLEDGTLSAGMAELIVAKNREGEVGIYTMEVSLKCSKFKDWDRPAIPIQIASDKLPGNVPGAIQGTIPGMEDQDTENPF
jgi:replicative DNA helicase